MGKCAEVSENTLEPPLIRPVTLSGAGLGRVGRSMSHKREL